ncbi:hypothetical protein [Azohydromonas aeria]|uniref:hypothetical protein n=1 Tax=Azohydromonas aeria TaxID=2590212 RepID=UPI0012F9D6DB|nr:hypothetical protein [Azohydromonas aeria]
MRDAGAALPWHPAGDARGGVAAFGQRLLPGALWVAIALSALEGPVRYALHAVGLDALFFLRDALLLGAVLAWLLGRAAAGAGIPVAAGLFAAVMLAHGLVSLLNTGSLVPAVYGLKMFLPLLCGLLAAQALFEPGRGQLRLAALLWCASVAAAAADKFLLDFPWVGLSVALGDVDVYLGRDWQSGSIERVAGLARSSINLAIVLTLLAFVLLGQLRHALLRAAVAGLTLLVLVWTTQKGAILGCALALLALGLSAPRRLLPLKAAALVAAVLMVGTPLVLVHLSLPRDAGVFSFESLIERAEWMWPRAWQWIDRFPPGVGVGLGGIGGGQRFFAPRDFNAADNLFVYLWGNFGVAALAYLGALLAWALNARSRGSRADALALASLVFLLMYGVVISLVEDQVAALWLGAMLGWLLRLQPEGPAR